jgi:hypothetical protein
MRLDLASLDAADRDRIGSRLLGLLLRSPWRRPADWSKCALVHHPGRREIVARAQVAEELRAGGLEQAAHEAIARHVGPGQVLVWLCVDSESSALAGFVVVELLAGGKVRGARR